MIICILFFRLLSLSYLTYQQSFLSSNHPNLLFALQNSYFEADDCSKMNFKKAQNRAGLVAPNNLLKYTSYPITACEHFAFECTSLLQGNQVKKRGGASEANSLFLKIKKWYFQKVFHLNLFFTKILLQTGLKNLTLKS